MALKSRKVFSVIRTVIAVFSLVSSPFAQTQRELLRDRPSQPQGQQLTEEEKKAAKELEKKVLALIDDIVGEAPSLKLVENRAYILTSASDLLWTHDEVRARAIMKEAMDQVIAQLREAGEKAAHDDGQYFDSRYPRQYNAPYVLQTILNILGKRDPKLALEFLKSIRSLQPAGAAGNRAEEQQEKAMELEIASHLAESDPQAALRIAEEHLDGKLDYQLINLWNALQKKDPQAASTLTDKIISSLKSQDILGDYAASGFAFGVLNVLRSRASEMANARNNPDAANTPQFDPAEIQQAYRDALDSVAGAALKITVNSLINQDNANRARNLLNQLPSYLPDIEKYLPSRLAAVRAKVAQFDSAKYGSPYEKFYAEYGNDLPNKSIQELLALAAKAPQEVQPNIYNQAAYKAVEQGDEETARKIIKENIPDTWQANGMLYNLEVTKSQRAASEGKYVEARKSLARMATDEQRASALAGWASAAAGKGDEKSAREMLEEARTLIGSRMQRSDQLEAQVAVAAAAVNLDPEMSFEIADAAIDRINRLVAANLELQTFGGMEEGETKILGGSVWGGYSGSIVQLFVALARRDFDRAANLLKHWQANEIRLMISLSIAQSVLNEQGVVRYGLGQGFGMRPIPSVRLAPASTIRE